MTDLNKDLNACGRNRPNHYKSPRLVRCESEMDYDAPVLLSQWQLMVLGSFWLPTLFFFNAFISFLIPNISLEVSGSNKSATLGYTFTASALLSIVVVPIVGALSDRTTFSMGKRKPYLLCSATLMCLGTLIIRFVNTEWQLILVYLAAGLGTNVAFAIFSALLPDNVPIEQRGTASSWSAFFSAIGNLSGGIVPGIVIQRVGLAACTYIIAAIIAAGTAVVVVFARDEPYRPSRRNDSVGHCTSRQDSANEEGSNLIEATNFTFENSDRISASRTRQPSDRSGCWVSLLRATLRRLWKILFRPFDSRDFVCGYFCNVFFIASALTLSEFLQFYFQDEVKTFSIFTVIHLRSSNTAVSVWNGISSTVSIFFTILAGIYAYRVGFRWLLITGSIITGLGLGVTMATTDYPGALVAGVVYGIGNGLGFTGLFGLLAGIVHNPQRAAVVLEIDEVTPSEIESLIHSEHGKSSNQQTATDACIDAQDVGDVTTQAEPKDGNCNHDSDSDNGNASSLGVLNMATGLSQVLASLVNGQVLAGFTEHHWIDGRDSSYGMETGYRVVFGLGITYALLAALFTFFVRKVR